MNHESCRFGEAIIHATKELNSGVHLPHNQLVQLRCHSRSTLHHPWSLPAMHMRLELSFAHLRHIRIDTAACTTQWQVVHIRVDRSTICNVVTEGEQQYIPVYLCPQLEL
jgi:hypothetical protein